MITDNLNSRGQRSLQRGLEADCRGLKSQVEVRENPAFTSWLRCVAHLDQQVADLLVTCFCGDVERGALVLGFHLEVGVNSIDWWTDKDIGYQIDSSIG